jgi:hypothetical protein
MKTQDTINTELEDLDQDVQDTEDAELDEDSLTPVNTAEQKLSKEIFFPKQKKINPKDSDQRAIWIAETMFNKFVETNEDWTLNTDKIPKEFAWTKDVIMKMYSSPKAKEDELDALLEKKLAERDAKSLESQYSQKVDELINDETLTQEEKKEIAKEADSLRAEGISKLKALELAKKLIVWTQSKTSFWKTLHVWRIPNSNKMQYTELELSQMDQKTYEKVTANVEAWKVRIV